MPAPQHPLISVVDVATAVRHPESDEPENMMLEFYSIAAKRMHNVKVKYGQQPFDFNKGVLSFMVPRQVFSLAVDKKGKK